MFEWNYWLETFESRARARLVRPVDGAGLNATMTW